MTKNDKITLKLIILSILIALVIWGYFQYYRSKCKKVVTIAHIYKFQKTYVGKVYFWYEFIIDGNLHKGSEQTSADYLKRENSKIDYTGAYCYVELCLEYPESTSELLYNKVYFNKSKEMGQIHRSSN